MIESQYGDKTFPPFVKWLMGWQVGYPHSTSSAKESHEVHRELTKTCVRTLTKIRRWPVPWTLTGTSCNRGCFYIALCCLLFSLHFVFKFLLLQVFLLCTKLQGHRQVWDVPTGFEVNLHCCLRFATEYVRARYIGYTANVTFNEGVQENRTGKRTSSRALSFFKQVSSFYAKWYSQFVPPAEPKRSRCPVQPLQRGLPHVWILNIALSCSCIAIKISFENPWKKVVFYIGCIWLWSEIL